MLIVLIILSAFLALTNLGGPILWDESEAMYASVAHNMLQSGDWLTQMYNGSPWFVHAPLYPWITNISSWIIGWSETTVRAGAALSYVGIVLVTVLLGTTLFDRRVGLWAAFITATTFQLIVSAHVGVYDTLLLLSTLVALWGLYAGFAFGSQKHFLIAALAMGLGALTKGPVAFVYPFLIALPFAMMREESNGRKESRIVRLRGATIAWGVLIFFAVAAPWSFSQVLIHGDKFTAYLLGYQSFGRYFDVVESQTGAWWYYFPLIPLGFIPWSGTLVGSLPHLIRMIRSRPGQFLGLWIGLSLVFFSIAQTKLINYIIPIYPALAIITAKLFVDVFDTVDHTDNAVTRRLARLAIVVNGLILTVVGAAGLYYVATQPPVVDTLTAISILGIALLGLAVTGVVTLAISWQPRVPAAAVSALTVIGMTFFMGWIMIVGLPKIEPYRGQTKDIALILTQQLNPEESFIVYQSPRLSSPVVYSGRRVDHVQDAINLGAMVTARQAAGRPAIVIMHRDVFIREFAGLPFRVIHQDRELVVLKADAEIKKMEEKAEEVPSS